MSVEKKYQKLTDVEHVLKRPARYVGSTKPHTAMSWAVDDGKIVKKSITYNPALLKLFDEIISNSVDESKRPDSHLDTIKVKIEPNGKITVEDNGGIPVVVHKEHKQYVPEMIFSELRAGSNFDDDNTDMVTGQNGEGSSLVTILSTSFKVTTADGKNKFMQVFKNNLSTRSKPSIAPDARQFTKIEFIPDYERLGCELDEGNMDKLIKRVYDVAGCNPKLKVSLNGKRIKINSFKDYIKLHTDSFQYCENEHWRVGVAGSEDGFQHVSFVNGSETHLGGTHINYVMNQIVDDLRDFFKRKHKVNVRPADIKNHMMLFVDCSIHNPRYSSQTKEDLITEVRDYGTEFEVPKTVINKIIKSDVIQDVLDWVESKQNAAEKAALRKSQKALSKKKVASHIPANGKDREKTTLFITEGLSAISNLVNVRDTNLHGGFPLKGKPKNINGMKPTDIVKNEELNNIMSILGLVIGEPATDLNYGRVAIMSDQDPDGLCIRALLVNFFSMWKELFEDERIVILQTPLIIARKGKDVKRYYSMADYQKDVDNVAGYEIEYLKGLGSLSVDEYDRAINEPIFDVVELDDDGEQRIEMAFGKDTNKRKEWLLA